MVRLFHREYECYLSAEGSFAESSPIIEDGKLASHITHPHIIHTPHSALSQASQ